MNTTSENLSLDLQHFSAELKRLERRLKSEAAPDTVALNAFRHAVDNVRLTAWSVSELINAERTKKNPDTVLAFLAAERLRRFEQLVKNLCADIDRQIITFQTDDMRSLRDSVEALDIRLRQCFSQLKSRVQNTASK